SGNASFGSQPGEVYNAAVVVYQDAANRMQYTAVPMNGSATISGSHYTFALITDSAGAVPGNTGTVSVTELDQANNVIGGGTIFAGSATPAQTGPVQISSGNAAFFDSAALLQTYRVSVTG